MLTSTRRTQFQRNFPCFFLGFFFFRIVKSQDETHLFPLIYFTLLEDYLIKISSSKSYFVFKSNIEYWQRYKMERFFGLFLARKMCWHACRAPNIYFFWDCVIVSNWLAVLRQNSKWRHYRKESYRKDSSSWKRPKNCKFISNFWNFNS